jgi:PPK2 family polyphosphate:nucleotide phosphotransferase
MNKTQEDAGPDHERFLFKPGKPIQLEKIDTDSDAGFESDDAARDSLKQTVEQMFKYQERLMAHETYGLLILFQGMDASGKDEAISHVLTSADPRGCEFKQFKKMTPKEEKHDYLWRVMASLPARGQIGIFDRSYYEQVIADRIHPESLDAQGLASELKKDIWEQRFRHINNFERYLTENGIHVLKFYLHVSKLEQRKRLLERIDQREMQWQFSTRDVKERAHWKEYGTAYSEALTKTNTAEAPWYVIPADRSWCARAAVASVIVEKLKSFHSGYPRLSAEEKQELEDARRELEKDDSST